MPIRRLIVLAVSGLLVAAVAFTIWQGYQLQRELTRAESSVTAVRAALSEDDAAIEIERSPTCRTRRPMLTEPHWRCLVGHAHSRSLLRR